MVECINREDALNFELEAELDPDIVPYVIQGMRLYMNYLSDLPCVLVPKAFSLTETRHICKWSPWKIAKKDPYGNNIFGYECSGCGYLADEQFNYCPECGAKMEGETE